MDTEGLFTRDIKILAQAFTAGKETAAKKGENFALGHVMSEWQSKRSQAVPSGSTAEKADSIVSQSTLPQPTQNEFPTDFLTFLKNSTQKISRDHKLAALQFKWILQDEKGLGDNKVIKETASLSHERGQLNEEALSLETTVKKEKTANEAAKKDGKLTRFSQWRLEAHEKRLQKVNDRLAEINLRMTELGKTIQQRKKELFEKHQDLRSKAHILSSIGKLASEAKAAGITKEQIPEGLSDSQSALMRLKSFELKHSAILASKGPNQNSELETFLNDFHDMKPLAYEKPTSGAEREYNKILSKIGRKVAEINPSEVSVKPEIAVELGKRFEEGIGVKQDFEKAASWYRTTLKSNHPKANEAKYNLALMYIKNNPDDPTGTSLNLFKQLADGDPPHFRAAYYAGRLYHDKKDVINAAKYYDIAAKTGDTNAINNLGVLKYDESQRLLNEAKGDEDKTRAAETEEEAKKLFKRAANGCPENPEWGQPNIDAMYNAGKIDLEDKAVIYKSQAALWLSKAALKRHKKAKELLKTTVDEATNFPGKKTISNWLYVQSILDITSPWTDLIMNAAALAPENNEKAYYVRQAAFKENDTNKKVLLFTKAADLASDNNTKAENLTSAANWEEDHAKKVQLFTKAANLTTNNNKKAKLLSSAANFEKDHAKKVQLFTEAANLTTNNNKKAKLLSSAANFEKDHAKKVQLFTKAANLANQERKHFYLILAACFEDDPKKALNLCDRAANSTTETQVENTEQIYALTYHVLQKISPEKAVELQKERTLNFTSIQNWNIPLKVEPFTEYFPKPTVEQNIT